MRNPSSTTNRLRDRAIALVALLTMTGAIVLAGAGTAEAASRRTNGRIAYTREGTIWTMNADGTEQAPLLPATIYATRSDPAWDPGGGRLAYTVTSALGSDIWVVRSDGTDTVNLTQTASIDESQPAWSPDRSKIAYVRDDTIWTMNADGTGQAPLLPASLPVKRSHPAWSPDGSTIVFTRSTPGLSSEIVAVNADGTGEHALTSTPLVDETMPAWSPDGSKIAYEADGRIWTMNADGTSPAELPGQAGPGFWKDPSWSPDGTKIVYVRFASPAAGDDVGSIDVDGSNDTNLTTTFGTDESSPSWQPVFAVAGPSTVGLFDPATGIWNLRDEDDAITSFYYGDPGDVPFVGDWDCDGIDTPGLYRQSDGFAYLRNSNSQGVADITFFFGNPSDVPLAGDFDGDGCDTLSLYRPSEQRFYIVDELGQDGGGLGPADYWFVFGNPGDTPVVGDWDGDGIDEIGLYRESTGFFYYRNTLDTGVADGQFYFGDPQDRFVAGDWGVIDWEDTPAVYRGADRTFYFRHTLTEGVADSQLVWSTAGTHWLPIAGHFGLD